MANPAVARHKAPQKNYLKSTSYFCAEPNRSVASRGLGCRTMQGAAAMGGRRGSNGVPGKRV